MLLIRKRTFLDKIYKCFRENTYKMAERKTIEGILKKINEVITTQNIAGVAGNDDTDCDKTKIKTKIVIENNGEEHLIDFHGIIFSESLGNRVIYSFSKKMLMRREYKNTVYPDLGPGKRDYSIPETEQVLMDLDLGRQYTGTSQSSNHGMYRLVY